MAGTLFNIFYILRNRFSFTQAQIIHPWGIPLPPVLHLSLDESIVNRYDEILVIGDVHGCFDEMFECIQSAHNDNQNSKILKLFVGDLVNKGEKNIEVLDYLMNQGKDDCLAVRGNHDEHIIEEYAKSKKDLTSVRPEYQWVGVLNQEQVDFLSKLPYTITVTPLNVTIVHAGLVPGIPLEDNQPFDMCNMRNLVVDDQSGNYKPTKYDKLGDPWASLWKGPNHIYFGHDARRGHQLHKFATGLDTGCVYGKQLTSVFIKGPRKGAYINVKAKKPYSPIRGGD